MTALAPIVLFVFNRPEHTRLTLQALKQNPLAKKTILYIYADGPKEGMSQVELNSIDEVRRLIRTEQWCREVKIIESDHNRGLGNNIRMGVTEVVNRHGKVIVLEDDLIVSRGFLKYMNDALNMYENDDRVMHVSGFISPINAELPETFFLERSSSWGWATWKRAWKLLDSDVNSLIEKLKNYDIKKFDCDGVIPLYRQLLDNRDGKINTWSILWLTSIYLHKGLCLYPKKSLVRNIGHDGSGTHCDPNETFNTLEIVDNIKVERIDLVPNEKAYREGLKFYKQIYGIEPLSAGRQIKNRIKNKLRFIRHLLPF